MNTPPPTLKRPADHLIRRFDVAMVGDRTIGMLLEKGFSLIICCKDCPRMVEWTPPELQQRFANRPNLKLADLVPRLSCTGEEGCGSQEVAVFPQLFDGAWRWPPPEDQAGTTPS